MIINLDEKNEKYLNDSLLHIPPFDVCPKNSTS